MKLRFDNYYLLFSINFIYSLNVFIIIISGFMFLGCLLKKIYIFCPVLQFSLYHSRVNYFEKRQCK